MARSAHNSLNGPNSLINGFGPEASIAGLTELEALLARASVLKHILKFKAYNKIVIQFRTMVKFLSRKNYRKVPSKTAIEPAGTATAPCPLKK